MFEVRNKFFNIYSNPFFISLKNNLFNPFNKVYFTPNFIIPIENSPNLLNNNRIYNFRRHRGGKVKHKLRNLEKKKKREQLLNDQLNSVNNN
ncbi:hypothetical protein TpMuguga_01g02840 [Theileria parva strain Muguga]|uniref:uncharacterized protein n=1 Tax=Theileria parva strain Muguga TaxID=333668 RepID=UPI001C61BE9D|nr:uncharacterized protein TpMuguga_01g02840 [Theileria parva strain Muguga]KAF5153461.1 hypothetical protein TpMuguga_01g02840 [Theileria parva strain Muguga]